MIIACFFSLFYTLVAYFYQGKIVFISKMLASLSFFGLGLFNFFTNNNLANLILVVSLGFALLGDIILGLRRLLKRPNYLKGGILAFLAGHLGYFIYALYYTVNFFKVLVLSLVGTIILVLLLLKFANILALNYGKYEKYAKIYLIFLAFTVVYNYLVFYSLGFNKLYLIGLGLFILSDIILSLCYFQEKNEKIFALLNHLTYYSAVILIAVSIK